jgi:short subunit dehydrogenase-like uncharacterized protein
MSAQLMIYGANGYTGALIARAAVRSGLKPLLAGRSRETLEPLARELGLHRRVFPLLGAKSIAASLDDVGAVLNCAGPFSATCAPLLEACLAKRVHYLDITGEIDVFAHCHAQHERAQAAGIVVAPGVGFDVVPTDCLAAMLKARLPRADELVLAFDGGGGMSPGTAKTSVEGLRKGGRARIHGRVVEVPLAWKVRRFGSGESARTAVTIPWGDVYTAFVSTGIASIETYMAMPPRAIAQIRRMRWLRPLLRFGALEAWMKKRIEAKVRGPDEARRAATTTHVWGEVRSADGGEAKLELLTSNGYTLTVDAALAIARRVLEQPAAGGYYTPSQLMGAEFVLTLPGVRLVEPA